MPSRHYGAMAWTSTVLVALGTTLATTAGLELTIGPRLRARSIRIAQARADRDQFNRYLITVIARCAGLAHWKPSPGLPGDLRSRLDAEHDRWIRQVDEATLWMIDNLHAYALGYVGHLGLRELLLEYGTRVRGLWISRRSEEDRVRLLGELSEPVLEIFFSRRTPKRAARIPGEVRKLRSLLFALDQPSNDREGERAEVRSFSTLPRQSSS